MLFNLCIIFHTYTHTLFSFCSVGLHLFIVPFGCGKLLKTYIVVNILFIRTNPTNWTYYKSNLTWHQLHISTKYYLKLLIKCARENFSDSKIFSVQSGPSLIFIKIAPINISGQASILKAEPFNKRKKV